ncbi:MAG: uroporphyrinogen decarboxylase family protein [Acidobacteriaceae bacterium]|nr:uroporphyrinogen decarboxylase family protein [Acidobacteriaceae bacterium]
MTSLERVRNTVAGKPVDHLACQPMTMMFSAKHAGMKYIDYTRDGRKLAEAQIRTWHDFQIDALLTCSDPAREVIDIAGEGSVEWYENQGPAIMEERAALKEKSRLKKFRLPDLDPAGRMYDRIRAIEIMRSEAGQETSVVGWVEGPLALAAELRGISRVMTDFIDEPEFARDLLHFCADVAILYADAQITSGADTIGMSDAAASMMGPKLYKTFLLDEQMRVFDHIKRNHPEVMTRSHMCGKTNALAAEMRALPVDIYEIDFPSDLAKVKSQLGDRVISGNISTVADMFEGTPEQVYQAASKCHEVCGKYFIVSCGCEVPRDAPPENLRALVRYATEHTTG